MPTGEPRIQPSSRAGSVYWLPPTSTGNGLEARAWAPLADLSARAAHEILRRCRSAHVAAATAPRGGGRPRLSVPVYRVWVDSEHVTAAEDVLRTVIAEARDAHKAGA